MIAASFAALCALGLAVRQESAPAPELLAVTWNLRFAADDAYPWATERLGLSVELWKERDPDLVGTQEGLFEQVRDLARALPEWDWIGLGREGGSRGEHCAIFYRRARFEPLELDHFWLSDSPERIGSRSFGNQVVRMATWVRLLDRTSGTQLVVLNAHFDHQSAPSRERSAELVARRLMAFDPALPLIVLGDFNAAPESAPYRLLLEGAGLADSWLGAPERDPELATYHGYRGPTPGGARIDWILHRGPLVPLEARIWTFERAGRYPSDHFPLAVRLRLVRPE